LTERDEVVNENTGVSNIKGEEQRIQIIILQILNRAR